MLEPASAALHALLRAVARLEVIGEELRSAASRVLRDQGGATGDHAVTCRTTRRQHALRAGTIQRIEALLQELRRPPRVDAVASSASAFRCAGQRRLAIELAMQVLQACRSSALRNLRRQLLLDAAFARRGGFVTARGCGCHPRPAGCDVAGPLARILRLRQYTRRTLTLDALFPRQPDAGGILAHRCFTGRALVRIRQSCARGQASRERFVCGCRDRPSCTRPDDRHGQRQDQKPGSACRCKGPLAKPRHPPMAHSIHSHHQRSPDAHFAMTSRCRDC